MLTGMPLIMYNPYSNTPMLAPCTVKSGSTYINYKLTPEQHDNIQKYIGHDLELIPSMMSTDENENERLAYYLSINIYNCSSPLFKLVSNEDVTRCEINTYIKNKKDQEGTLIIDYVSNKGSIDPVYIYQNSGDASFRKRIDTIVGKVNESNIYLDFSYYETKFDKEFKVDKNLIELTDNIFYRNGIIDKLYYDKSLVYSRKNIPELLKVNFTFLNMTFENPESIFYFTKDIEFVGSIWNNLI